MDDRACLLKERVQAYRERLFAGVRHDEAEYLLQAILELDAQIAREEHSPGLSLQPA